MTRSVFILSFILLCGVFTEVNAQYKITGKVVASQSLEPINNVEVFVNETGRSYRTNKEGVYTITGLPDGVYTLFYFALGYAIESQVITVDGVDQFVDIKMQMLSDTLTEVVVTNQREEIFTIKRLREVEGTAIYAGKKTEVVLLDNMVANTATNNARQVFAQVAGLNIYESNDAGLQLNIGGRGLDPNRSANFNIRQNGYDISADVLGYPESYYTPPTEALKEIQVIRGAASLQYGTQFGGLVNFKMKTPNPNEKFEFLSRQTVGSNQLITNFSSISGTLNKLGYYSFFNYKTGDGFRPNSDFDSHNFYTVLNYDLTRKTTAQLEFTYFKYLAQQPGGLTDAQFYTDPTFSNRERNWFEVDWKLAALKLNHKFSNQTEWSVTAFGLDASRKSVGFRTNRVSQNDDPTAPRDLILGDFNNGGIETRFLHRYKIGDRNSVFLIGSKYYQSNNTSFQGPGSAGSDADFNPATESYPNYPNQSDFKFPNKNLAVFGEHIFYLSDKFSITPGFRFEYIKTQSAGTYKRINFDLAGNPIQNQTFEDNRTFKRNFLLLGTGFSYLPNEHTEFYANVSQNYRSVTFNDIRVINPTYQVDPNISDESGYTTDLGVRGKTGSILSYDLSGFALSYNDRLGEVLKPETRTNASGQQEETGRIVRYRGNIGQAFMVGLESLIDLNIIELFGSNPKETKLTVFANTAITKSKYISSELPGVEGNEVEFIPLVNLKTGINAGYKNLIGSLQYTYLSKQYTDASNAKQNPHDNQSGIQGEIPAYDIVDLSLSFTKKWFKIESGINNLLDKSYFTRRATGYPGPGIIPSPPRTYYVTLQLQLK